MPGTLAPPPWPYAKKCEGFSTVHELPAPVPSPFIQPKVYNRPRLPRSDKELPLLHAPGPLKLTAATDIVLLPGNVVLTRKGRILPQTFLRHRRSLHGAVRKRQWSDRFEPCVPVGNLELETIDRPLFFADTDHPDVYGHVLLEALPRLWALRRAGIAVSVATSVPVSGAYAPLFRRLGVDIDSVTAIDRPIHGKMILFPDLPMRRRSWIHPAAWEVFHALAGLGDRSDVGTPERIYLSRSRVPGRRLVNELAIEALFKRMGFAIIHPQEMPIEAQIRVFSHARCFASAGGSSAHNALFAPQASRVLILSSESWLVNADILLSQTPGRLGYVFGRPLQLPIRSHRSQSDWQIDPDEVAAAARIHFDIPG